MVAALLLFCSCGAEISLRKGDQSYAFDAKGSFNNASFSNVLHFSMVIVLV